MKEYEHTQSEYPLFLCNIETIKLPDSKNFSYDFYYSKKHQGYALIQQATRWKSVAIISKKEVE